MKRVFATATLGLGLLLSAPAQAQVGVHDGFSVGQGPFNAFVAQRSQPRMSRAASYGMPPANARCGWFMGRLTGHTDRSLWLAQNWARKFPRTQARPGAVVVWNRGGNKGHVAKIVAMQTSCRATVTDNMGTYTRDICRGVMAYVQP